MSRSVAVTGIGVVTNIGHRIPQFWSNCLSGESLVAEIPANWRNFADYHSTIWSPLDFDPEAFDLSRVDTAQNDPVSLIALHAASSALQHSGFSLEVKDKRARTFRVSGVDSARAGVFMGTGVGGAKSFLENHSYQVLARQKVRLQEIRDSLDEDASQGAALDEVSSHFELPPRFNPFVVSMLMPNAVSALLGQKFSFFGPNLTYALACASGTVAIGKAFEAVRCGELDLAMAGGSEYLDDHYGGIFLGFDVAGALVRNCDNPDAANRPFDKNRSGFLFGQGGAAVLILEPTDLARDRGAQIISEIVGYGESFDAFSMMRLDPEAKEIERMMRRTLADANLGAGDVQYINTHGTGTQANDVTEAMIIERVFGTSVLVNSTKSLLGHTIGASGAIEAAVVALSLFHQTTHACHNLDEPIADLNFIREVKPRDFQIGFSQSFAFGGHNAGLVMRRPRE